MEHNTAYRHRSISGADPIQEYLKLQTQQEHLRRRLSLQIPTSSPLTANHPESSSHSLSSSPTTPRSMLTSDPTTYYASPMSAYPSPATSFGYDSMAFDSAASEESQKLYEINQQIKATLTELLNTDSVKADDKFRVWLQGRLMDAEVEMRRQRRRRSTSNGDREVAESIADHFEHNSL